ncbi:hypothetical protein NDK43_02825 [Neobacillus pocheonensis]|uniref:Lipoprotein n=1 Tax=Neobacillus pocheonensis TaxID=363869 RepID=A0ABT0W5A7_9BACI|nr:hypothetical protein [Neobacillus pocheonensis]
MNKKQWMIPLSAVMVIGLAGCATNNRAGVTNNNENPARPMGYYSNEKHPTGTYPGLSDNDGP